jgi:hypothetical protein
MCIQVDQYPMLSSYRYPDGSWGLENMYVFFKQNGSLDADEIPIVTSIE